MHGRDSSPMLPSKEFIKLETRDIISKQSILKQSQITVTENLTYHKISASDRYCMTVSVPAAVPPRDRCSNSTGSRAFAKTIIHRFTISVKAAVR
jgi:hypothetical protein